MQTTKNGVSVWKKEEVQKYCNYIMGDRDVDVFYYPRKITGSTALAFPESKTIVFGRRKIRTCLWWHECGHLAEKSKRFNFEAFDSKWVTYWMDVYGKPVYELKGLGSKKKNDAFVHREAKAQVWAVKRAFEMCDKLMARSIYYMFSKGHSGLYLKAHKLMVEMLRRHGIKEGKR